MTDRELMQAVVTAFGPLDHTNLYLMQTIGDMEDRLEQPVIAPWVMLTSADVSKIWQSENGIEDCDLCKIDDFEKIALFFQAAFIAKQTETN
jgi:hypothetical protein